MTQITLTAEQTALLTSAVEPVIVLDPAGKRLGQISRQREMVFSPERIAAARQRLRTETGGVTTAELLNKLNSLGGTPCDTP